MDKRKITGLVLGVLFLFWVQTILELKSTTPMSEEYYQCVSGWKKHLRITPQLTPTAYFSCRNWVELPVK